MRRFLALSRATHGMLDIAMPGFVALLWLGAFPPLDILAVCLLTAAAGYAAIYALNDIAGVADDRAKVADGLTPGYAVEASQLRYPIAQNLLGMKAALGWFAVCFAVAMLGIWWLNPRILIILIAAAILELVYVKLLRVTWLRTIVGGLVKSAGPLAAVYAVVDAPAYGGLGLMIVWLMLWEIGGQNIPADWNDIEEDRRIGARTIPLAFGPAVARWLVLALLSLTVLASLALPTLSPVPLHGSAYAAIFIPGLILLIVPAIGLARALDARAAARLFDWSSLYPLTLLIVMTGFVVLR